ncbi:MAG: amylo-alpha-1,6-glucosidase [Dehalococcoidia bacterium]|nr:MAG: amylo-alpha-1,6-glucosidase [Dehalococcoidia bacterium]
MEQRVLKDNDLVMLSDERGDMPQTRRRLGLYFRDTRYLSIFELRINGQELRHLASSCRQNAVCDIQLANPTVTSRDGMPILARTIGVERNRYLLDGFHERITLYNYNSFDAQLDLELNIGGDFADIFEIRGLERKQRGTIIEPVATDSEVSFQYAGLDGIDRTMQVSFDTKPSAIKLEPQSQILGQRPSTFLPDATDITITTMLRPPCAKITWNLTVKPRDPLLLYIHIAAIEGQYQIEHVTYEQGLSKACQRYKDWCNECTEIETNNELFNNLLERSLLDLRLLQRWTSDGPIPDAGIPWFCCIFGSQSIVTALQTLMINPEISAETLHHLARHQGKQVDLSNEEEPGKIIHEMRSGEMARTSEIPHAAYYGSIDATPLFLILFAETMKWLDDDELYQEIIPSAKLALEWIIHYGDVDGDGYVEYVTHSTGGIGDQGWRDSRGAILHPDGTVVPQPITLALVQGYVYRALVEMAQLLIRKGEQKYARDLETRASILKQNFNRDFWLENNRYFAQALDPQKKPVENIVSSIGHCLYCGIVDEDKARYVVTRLSSPEMASGWGIRTLSSRSPNYNPMSYRNGSIWPYDNSLIVAGMKRYGYHWEVEEIISQVFEASAFLPYTRLPELYGGFHRNREAYSIPAQYPASCVPQAYSAGSAFLLFQSMLGLQADAASKRIYLSPRLPNWLQHAAVRNLRIGRKTLNLQFERQLTDEETRFEISDNEAEAEVVIPPR